MSHREILQRASLAHACADALVAAVAGVALYASFPPVGWWWLSIPALALYFSRVDQARAPRAAAVTVAFGMSMWLPLLDWIPLSVGSRPPWFALALVQTLFLLAWVIPVRWVQAWPWARGPLAQATVYALSWSGVEVARSRWPWSGFPWGSVALPQVDSPLGHLAPYGGTPVVACGVVFIAVLVRRMFAHRDAATRDERWFSRPLLAAIALACYVTPAVIALPNQAQEGFLRVGVVQGDIALPGAQAYRREGEVTGNNARATMQLARERQVSSHPIDLALWGEGSVDRDPLEFPGVAERINEASEAVGAPILMGYTNLNERDRVKNWLAVWEPGVGVDENARYSKHVPVPFGEFIPFREFISSFATEVAQSSRDMEAGSEPPLMTVTARDGRAIPLAVGICFEAAYPTVIGQGVTLGGQMIVTPSNNYHFRSSGESAQQGQLLRMRAMEYSRSAIQASTTGHSYVIRPDGTVLSSTGTEQSATLVADVPLRSSMTLTARAGDRLPVAVLAAAAAIGLVGLAGAWRLHSQRRRHPARAHSGASRQNVTHD